jgi:glutamate N-acetyltransferase/amino-acid N-acetyltransferase
MLTAIEHEINNDVTTEIGGGITSPKGFRAAGIYCGIRKVKKDLMLLVSDVPANISAVFTQSKTVAAPVIVSREQIARANGICSAIIVNSGVANACTGEQGMMDAWKMVQATASALNIPSEQVVVSSTGVIGQFLPMDKITSGIAQIKSVVTTDGGHDAAEAIMTTDTYAKELAVSVQLSSGTITIGGMAKGSGMIAPNMATMLAFMTTDAAISQPLLDKAFKQAINKSFNRISVDGDTSTNDMASILANGKAGNQMISKEDGDYAIFSEALDQSLIKLAKMIVTDGEGATKIVEIIVTGTATDADALTAAKTVANSSLVKTAIHGADANWGRILAACGRSGIDFDPAMAEIYFDDMPVLKKNYDIVLDEVRALEILKKDSLVISISLGSGPGTANFWTCDLSKEYVHINASYRS